METTARGELSIEIEVDGAIDPQVVSRLRAKICALPTLLNFECLSPGKSAAKVWPRL